MTIPPDRSDQIFSSQPVKPGPTTPQTGPDFKGYMAETPAPGKPFTPGPSTPIAPVSTQVPQAAGPTFESVLSQISTSQDSYNNVRNQLNTNNLQLKRSQQHLLRNKLSDASTHLRAANSKLGAETPPMPSQSGARPIERFINYVTDGQNQLAAAQQQISDMQKKGDKANPGDFLLIQVKMSQAQQEIEYSSMLLGKVIDSLKQTLNIPL